MMFLRTTYLSSPIAWIGLLLVLSWQCLQAATICDQVTEVPKSQCQALLDLYDSTNGNGWANRTDWKETNTPCSWFGVSCDGGEVSRIALLFNQLSGSIPDLSALANLQWLFLRGNQLTGTIPDFNLPHLKTLDLGENQLSETIPQFSALVNLKGLSLQDNQLSGTIPNFSALTELTTLNFSGNTALCRNPNTNYGDWTAEVSGFSECHFSCDSVTEIPKAQCEALVALYDSTDGDNWKDKTGWLQNNTPCSWKGVSCSGSEVTRIFLSSNQLSGSIPNFSALINLRYLELYNNQLSGSIPDFNTLTNLQSLNLTNNQLSGSIPDFSALTNLRELRLYNNQLSGSIPDFSALTNLQTLYLYNNQLSSSIPDFNTLTNLQSLFLYGNQLSGSIPDFNTLTNLQSLNLTNNQLSSSIPDFNALTNLRELRLYNNQLSGSIPDFSALTNLQTLYLNDNQLTGSIPNFSALTNLQQLNINNNPELCKNPNTNYGKWTTTLSSFSECGICETVTEIPKAQCEALVALYDSTDGDNWADNTAWKQTNTPCSWKGVKCSGGHVIEINHFQGGLKGNLPDLSNLTNLQKLYLWRNQLTGDIPDLSNLTALKYLNLGENQLSGSIPDLSNLTALQSFDVHSNQLSNLPDLKNLTALQTFSAYSNELNGSMPNFINLPALRTIRLGNNKLSGSIPNLSALTSLTYLELNINQLTGNIPNLSALTNLSTLDLGNNQLTGSIPELSNLTALRKLKLHNNQLTGSIPTLSSLIALRYLDLSFNRLTGSIPDLSALTTLQNLYLHHNQLSGRIPDLKPLTALKSFSLANDTLGILGLYNEGSLQGGDYDASWYIHGDGYFVTRDNAFSTHNTSGKTISKEDSYFVFQHTANISVSDKVAVTLAGKASGSTNLVGIDIFLSIDGSNWTLLGTTPQNNWLGYGAFTVKGNPNIQGNELYVKVSPNSQITGASVYLERVNVDISPSLCATQSEIPTAQCETLVALYDSTEGDNWTNKTSWKVTNTPCSWFGVTCGNGEITEIDLKDNNLSGTLPNLSALTSLEKLTLHSLKPEESVTPNKLTGTIPDLSHFTNLQVLSLGHNQLSGPIPDLSSLTQLTFLNLKANQLTGAFPDLTNLTNLQVLWIGSNQLTGKFPDLTALTNLKSIGIGNSQLTGTIPDLSQHTALETIWLQKNQFTGTIPDLSKLTKLRQVHLNHNQLTGNIPDLAVLTQLQEFGIGNNQISGTIPDLSTLTKLEGFWVDNNKLMGAIPDLSALTSLQSLRLMGNQLCQDADADYGDWTEVNEFLVCGNPNITLTSPVHGATDIPISGQVFDWESTIGTYYRIVISTQADFAGFTEDGGNSVCDATCITTSMKSTLYTVSNLFENTLYYWKVRADVDSINWSEIWSFTTGAAPKTGCNGNIKLPNNLCEGLTLHMSMDGNAKDVSGNGNDGVVNGATLTTDRYDVADTAYSLNGTTDRIKLDHRAMNGLASFSIGFWAKTTQTDSSKYLISASNSAGQYNEFLIKQDAGKITILIKGVEHKFDTPIINDGVWHLVNLVRSSSTVQVFIDGSLVDTWLTAPINDLEVSLSGFWLGGDQDCLGGCWDGNQQFGGVIDDLLIHNRVLTDAEIQNLYNAANPTPPVIMLEDAEDGDTTNWSIYDNVMGDAVLSNVVDSDKNSQVIDFTGNSKSGYKLANPDGSSLSTTNFIARWSMRTSTSALQGFFWRVKTSGTVLFLEYRTNTPLGCGITNSTSTDVICGLGDNLQDGTWHTIIRDLEADLKAAAPNLELQEVKFLQIRMAGRVDDIMLLNEMPVTDCNAVTEIPTTECEALVTLYDSTNGDNWTNQDGWKITNTPCSWYGVTCENNKIVKLNLYKNQLNGVISDISAFTNMRTLYLSSNQLSGNIPQLDALVNLQYLHLGDNQLTGHLPSLGTLTKLNEFYADNNQLSGIIPDLSNLTHLTYFHLKHNNLTGEIPDLSNLTQLSSIALEGNSLTGSIPDLSALTSLTSFGLTGNKLCQDSEADYAGHIGVDDFATCEFLDFFWLDSFAPEEPAEATGDFVLDNGVSYLVQVKGTVSVWGPDWEADGYCGTPEDSPLYPSPNKRNGAVGLDSEYGFSGKIGQAWICGGDMPLHRAANKMSVNDGDTWFFPKSLDSAYNPEHVYTYKVTGQGNALKVQFPDPHPNDNYGRFEVQVLPTATDCNTVTEIPTNQCEALVALYDNTVGDNWTNNRGWKKGNTPCSWHGVTCENEVVTAIDLMNNNLTGTVPDLSSLTGLWLLNLNDNQLNGTFPDFSALTSVTEIYLRLNQFSGPLPDDLSTLTNLVALDVGGNELNGLIPKLSSLTNLYNLWLYGNQFTGPIPDLPASLQGYLDLSGDDNKLCQNLEADYAGRTEVESFPICPDVKLIAEASTTEVCIGRDLTVTIKKQLAQTINQIQMVLSYDTNLLRVNTITNAGTLTQFNANDDNGTIQIEAGNFTGISDEFDIATLQLIPLGTSLITTVQFNDSQTTVKLNGTILRHESEGVLIAINDCPLGEILSEPEENSAIWSFIDKTAGLNAPKSISFDSTGNAYIADSLKHRILKRDTQGNITVVAGTRVKGFAGDNGPAIEAKLNNPQGIAIDGEGNLYIADTDNHRIRKIDSNGIITTVVGNGKRGFAGDNSLATAAKLRNPVAIVFDNNGHLYIADSGNHRIRKVTGQRTRKTNANSIITTFAGSRSGYRGDNAPANQARLSNPSGLAVDSQNNLYIADTDNHRIRKVDNRGTITTVAGNGVNGYSGDGDPAIAAKLNAPTGVEIDSAGNLFIADKDNHRIRKVNNEGMISTFTGTGRRGASTDGILSGVAQINQPTDVALDQYGNLYIADKGNNLIRKVGEKEGENGEAPPHQIADCPNTEITGIPESECYALIALYDSTNGPEWTNNDGWKATDTPCEWTGVTCANGSVTEINLNDNNLVGDMPDQIGGLPNLEQLNLNDNQISGAIPPTIEHLDKLETLNLANNDLTGSLPVELGDATNLQTVNLANNQISGEIPDLNSLTQIQDLNLSDNRFSGAVPDLTELTTLQTFEISGENQPLCQDSDTDVGNLPVGELDECPTSNQLPTAAFTATPNKGEAPLTIQLDARSSYDPYGNITVYFWESSDKQVLIGPTPTITFEKSGVYEIKLRVMDNDGAPSINVAKHLIEVSPSPEQVTLTLNKDGTGLGTISLRRDKEPVISCRSNCQDMSQDYPIGSELRLTTKAATGSLFTGWRGDCVGTEEDTRITVTMDSAKQCTAVFELEPTPPPAMHALTIDSVAAEFGSGGDVKVNDILCEKPPCVSYHQQGKNVKITAVPMPHAYFMSWNSDCPIHGTFEDATNLVVLTSDVICTAYFGNDSMPASEDTAQEFEEVAELSTGESVTEMYPEVDNRERYEQAFLVAEKAMMTAETQMIIPGEESWPDQFDEVEDFLKLPSNLWVKKVRIVSSEEMLGDYHVEGQYVRVDVLLLNKDGQEDLVPILVYYKEKPIIEETAPSTMEENNTRRGVRYKRCWWCRPPILYPRSFSRRGRR